MLKGEVDVGELLRRRGRPLGIRPTPSQGVVSVEITNDESDFYTIADVTANDRLGLLHDLTSVITERGYEIYISKAATVLDQVKDTFYLKDLEGKKLPDPAAIESLREGLLEVVSRGADDGAG